MWGAHALAQAVVLRLPGLEVAKQGSPVPGRSGSADAAIHEIVAAYCSGGEVGVIDENGFLEPAPLEAFGTNTFAKPVIASGAVDLDTLTVTDKPNVKFEDGTSVQGGLNSATADHPSAAHCPNNALP
jgi:hypothetical protein